MKVDLGCGRRKKEGYIGVDSIDFPGVDFVFDAGSAIYPWNDGTVDEIYSCHMVEHLKAEERVHLVNECHRVLKKGGLLYIQVPHWQSGRAYGDLTHQWPPVVDFWAYYLNKEWRDKFAPHSLEYTCDFDYEASAVMNSKMYEEFGDMAPHLNNGLDDLIIKLWKRGGNS